MAISVKKLTLWSGEIANEAGTLGRALRPFAEAGCDLHIVMAYEKPGDATRSVVEIAPITGVKAARAAQAAGLAQSSIACLLVEGDNRAGLGQATTTALGAAGINIQFHVTLVAGKKYRSVFGFGPQADLAAATKAIKAAATAAAKSAAKPKKRLK